MIYLIYGDNIKARGKAQQIVRKLSEKKPDASLIKLDTTNWQEKIDESISGQGLFEERFIVFCDNLFSTKDVRDEMLSKLSDLAKSENFFILLENSLDKKTIEKIKKKALKFQEFEVNKKAKIKEKFNVFALTDSLGRRDRRQTWVLYSKAKMENVSPEELQGLIFWQVKNIILAKDVNAAEEIEMNPFVFKKARAFSSNFSFDELKKLSTDLVESYHQARRGESEMDNSLERIILNL